jgi:hypothetical protein
MDQQDNVEGEILSKILQRKKNKLIFIANSGQKIICVAG